MSHREVVTFICKQLDHMAVTIRVPSLQSALNSAKGSKRRDVLTASSVEHVTPFILYQNVANH